MRHIPRFGIEDDEIIALFSQPIATILYSSPKGNMIFDVVIESTSGDRILVGAQMFDLDGWDEIAVLSVTKLLEDPPIQMVPGPAFPGVIQSVYKIVGEFDPEETCDVGLVIEGCAGTMCLVAGSHPTSINLIYPGFDQGIRMHSFQTFKYSFKRLHFYS
jgi:hypothetical protein